MYNPPHFQETRREILHELMHAHPLGALVTLTAGGLDANHLPFELAAGPGDGPLGTLRGHVARRNRVWQDFSPDHDALVIFQGPAAYVTPSWYETKKETGKVVPTYNYCVVHAHGPLIVHDDREWLRGMVTRLTHRFESVRPAPWAVTDAPADFIDQQLAAIVGIEIPIATLTGKWKVSQNRPAADRAGVARGLSGPGATDSAAMAELVRNFAPPGASS
ncbi:MAG: FMN-binding negative transcriptional regulator [Verrucomicrobia bacterium]|nr:FMN-binding negative transcriptional regulator [Verrucomicrobiota bacterium]